MSKKTLQFYQTDTWFFREAKPFDAIGGNELNSAFPPPVTTLLGAFRRFLGDAIDIRWQHLKTDNPIADNRLNLDFINAVGGAEDLGQLQIFGAWICYRQQRLYPAPLYLMQNSHGDLRRLEIGAQPVHCDLGRVRLPQMPKSLQGYKNLEGAWVTESGWQALLKGDVPPKTTLVFAKQLFTEEPRIGIALKPGTRTVQKSMLYQTQHLRLKNDIHIELDVEGLHPELNACLPTTGTFKRLRLGGEGRMADMAVAAGTPPLPKLPPKIKSRKFILHFITAADFSGDLWPEGFSKTVKNGQTVWQGVLNGIPLDIEAAVLGKAQREGGWDLQHNRPRAVKSLIPAGSVWFCRLTDDKTNWEKVLEKLHGWHIGNQTAYGRGQLLVGVWQDSI